MMTFVDKRSSRVGQPRRAWQPLLLLLIYMMFGPTMWAQAQSSTARGQQPNVLLIAVDDLNDWVEPLGGHPQAKTPNLLKFAKTATCFTNAHCQAPICNPSRASMLIGKLPSSTGIYYLGPRFRDCATTAKAVSLPQYFAAAGYQTIAAGKIFHGADKLEFDEYVGTFGGFGPRPGRPINGGQTHPLWDWGAFPPTDKFMPDAKIADWTIEQLQSEHRQPFFLACGFYRPHVPMFAPPKWFEPFPLESIQLPPHREDDFDDIPEYARDLSWSAVAPRHEWMQKNGQWKKAVQSYLACVNFVDAQIGRVLDALQESPYRDNTIVVLFSDHGFHLGTKQCWGKRSLWEDSTRVVLMMSGPAIGKGQKCSQPVGLIDVYPTLVELCGLQERPDLEGQSLVPQLKDARTPRKSYAITTFGRNNHSIRSERFRYTVYADGSQEFYDLEQDPHEFQNLAKDERYAEKLAEHQKFLPTVNRPMAAGSHNADARPGSAAEIPADRERRKNRKR